MRITCGGFNSSDQLEGRGDPSGRFPRKTCLQPAPPGPELSHSHNEVPGESDQGEEGAFQGGGQREALAAEGAEVGGLHYADVALRRDRVVCKGIALQGSRQAVVRMGGEGSAPDDERDTRSAPCGWPLWPYAFACAF